MESEKKLTPLEWAVYRLIRDKSYRAEEKGDGGWITQREIVEAVNSDPSLKEKLVWTEDDYNHCRKLWTIVNRLNQSGRIQKIIVVKNYRYKLGTRDECEEYFAKLRKDALAKLARVSALEWRAKKDGQGRLLTDELNPIDGKSRARYWIEAFMPEMVEAFEKATREEKETEVN